MISVQRTGGFAGRRDTVTVDAQGVWTVTDRAGTRRAGSLTADQATAIRILAADPRIVDEADQTRPPTRCRDAYSYVLTVGDTELAFVDCPADPDQPVASLALAKAVVRYTAPTLTIRNAASDDDPGSAV